MSPSDGARSLLQSLPMRASLGGIERRHCALLDIYVTLFSITTPALNVLS